MNKFRVKRGSVITSFLHATVTEHSTDAEIIAMLKVSPASIKFLSEYPENWQEIVSGKKKTKPKEDGESKDNSGQGQD